MKAVIQRVKKASVSVEGKVISEIGKGLVVFLGVEKGDTLKDAEFLANKIMKLRCFDDKKGKMNFAVNESGGELLVVSEVTLCTDLFSGHRPGFEQAAPPNEAERLYSDFLTLLDAQGGKTKEGKFKAQMDVEITNDGPVTFVLDSQSTE